MIDDILKQVESLLSDTTNFICNASNLAAYIYHEISDISWAGFYFLAGEELILGPFQGKTACTRITLGKGVCGTSAMKKETIIVPDVHKFPGHIACDSGSNSELVVPVIHNGAVICVLDLDSYKYDRFTKEDAELFNKLIHILLDKSDIKPLVNYYNDQPDKIKPSLENK